MQHYFLTCFKRYLVNTYIHASIFRYKQKLKYLMSIRFMTEMHVLRSTYELNAVLQELDIKLLNI